VFVGVVAYGDHEVVIADDVAHVCGVGGSQGQAVPAGDPDRAGMDGRRGVGAGRGGGDVAARGPQGGRELGAGGVVGADEHHPHDRLSRCRCQVGEGLVVQSQVGTAAVAFGAGAFDQPCVGQDAQVVGEQVGR